jgi:hypothetical protein
MCVLAAVAFLVGSCSSTSTTEREPSPPDLTRAEAITWARDIDPCALIDRDELESLGTVTATGTSGLSTDCEAVVDDGTDHGIGISWAVSFTPDDFHTAPFGAIENIDGVEARRIDSAEEQPAHQHEELVESRCNYDVPFENSIAVRMSVSMARDRDACTVGEQLVRNVISNWPEHPRQGSSPDTAVTVLTTAAPCAAVPELQQSHTVVFDWRNQSLNTCFLTIDGIDALVSFDYRELEQVTLDAEPAKFGDREGYSEVYGGTTFARAVVGGEFDGALATRERRLVPVVEVNGDNTAAVFAVTTAVLDRLPI